MRVPRGGRRLFFTSEDQMGETGIEKKIKELIVELLFLTDTSPEDIHDEDVLSETLAMDSVAVFQVVAGLEEEFAISFEDDTFEVEKFRSVASMAQVVRDKLAAKGQDA